MIRRKANRSRLPIKACPECIGTKETYVPLTDSIEPCTACSGKGIVPTDEDTAIEELQLRQALHITLPLILANTCWLV